jgi:hypothetical protein
VETLREFKTCILHLEQIVDDDSILLTIAHDKGFQPLGIFCDKYFEK